VSDAYVLDIVATLRARAADPLLKGSETARMAAALADEIESRRQAFLLEEIPIADAVRESGYSEANLRRLRRAGKWSGRRADLPQKPGASTPAPVNGTPTLAEQRLMRAQRRRA
jgi:hypothetical protein